ncbi:MAG: SRPBCC family protein [Pseudomonadota bacterium]
MKDRAAEAPFGTLGKLADGRSYVHFERLLPYSVDQVWATLTEQEQLDAWMPGVRFERRLGGRYEIWFGGDCDGPAHVSGEVVAYEPPHVLQLGTIRWELAATDRGCRLIFTDVLVVPEDRTVREIANLVLAGWHHYLDRLDEALAGDPIRTDAPEPDYRKRDLGLGIA